MFDTLNYNKKLESVGFSREQSETLVGSMAEIINNNLATKQDMKDFASATKQDMKDFASATKQDMKDLAAATKQDIANLASATKQDMKELRSEIKNLEYKIGQDFKDLELRLTIRLTIIVLGAPAVLKLFQYFLK